MGRHLSPRYGHAILVSGYPVLTAISFLIDYNMDVQYQVAGLVAGTLARKCTISHCMAQTDGRAGGRTVT